MEISHKYTRQADTSVLHYQIVFKCSSIQGFPELASLFFHVQIFPGTLLSIFNLLIYCFDLYWIVVHLFRR
jgi:hypothetical protein